MKVQSFSILALFTPPLTPPQYGGGNSGLSCPPVTRGDTGGSRKRFKKEFTFDKKSPIYSLSYIIHLLTIILLQLKKSKDGKGFPVGA